MKWSTLVLTVLGCTSVAAHADAACGEHWRAQLEGASPVGFLPARLGTAHNPCARNEVELGLAGRAIVEPDDFYGNITAAAALAGRVRLFERGELFGAFELLRYQTVISALTADNFAPGDLTLGGSWRFVETEQIAIAGFVRTLFPTARSLYENAKPFGAEVGASMHWVASPRWVLFGNVAALGTASASNGPTGARGAIALTAGGTYRPTHGLAFLFEVDGQSGYAAGLDHLAVGLGIRVHKDRRGFELYLKSPILGRERSLIVGGVRLRYDFDVVLDRRLR